MFDLEAMKANMEAGTPGGWSVSQVRRGFAIVSPDGRTVGAAHSNGRPLQQTANARRIASIPAMEAEIIRLNALIAELVEALTKAESRLMWCAGLLPTDKSRDQASEWAEEARAALEKAGVR